MSTSTHVLKAALVDGNGRLTDAALSDHGLHDEIYDLYKRERPTVSQKAMLIARLHELLLKDDGIRTVAQAVRSGSLRGLLGREFAWVLPFFEAEL